MKKTQKKSVKKVEESTMTITAKLLDWSFRRSLAVPSFDFGRIYGTNEAYFDKIVVDPNSVTFSVTTKTLSTVKKKKKR